MNDQIQALVALQDIDVLLSEIRNPAIAVEERRLGFAMENVAGIERARARLAGQIDGHLLQTYERMSRRLLRVVVPVEGTVCAGCHIAFPTSHGRGPVRHDALEHCENCGRILYRI